MLIRLLTLCLFATTTVVAQTTPAPRPQPTQHEYLLHNFHTESGATVPELKLVYGTYGTLNADHSNAILLPSHYMAEMHGYSWLIGPGNALQIEGPGALFLVTSELFGNGRSSSPSNTPAPFDGPRFPVMTIRDNVNAVHQMLTEQLGIQHLRAVIGFSMGAQQAFQWAVSYPAYMDRIVATSGTAKTYGHGIVRNEAQITAIQTDPAFKAGEYTTPPAAGLEAFNMVWLGWLYSQEWWHQELWKQSSPPGTTLRQVIERYRHNFIKGDANNLILQMRTWESNDVGATPVVPGGNQAAFGGDAEAALRSIRVPVLYMPSATDLYFPVTDAQHEAPFIAHCLLLPIPSLWGHPAGAGASPADHAFLNEHIAAFLAAPQQKE